MAMAISYNWLFLWDYTFYKWGWFSTNITGMTRALTVGARYQIFFSWPVFRMIYLIDHSQLIKALYIPVLEKSVSHPIYGMITPYI